jgi:hypothetical protein
VSRKRSSLLFLIAAIGCHHAMVARFTVVPPSPAVSDSTAYLDEAEGIMATLAARHELEQYEWRAPGSLGAFQGFGRDSLGYRTGLLLALFRSADGNLVYSLDETFTTAWGPRGDSLRRELEDTLQVHFPGRLLMPQR